MESEPESDSIRIPESGVGVGTAPPRLRTPGSLDALKPQNKNEHIARYEIGRFVLGFTGFAHLVTTGQAIDLKLTKIANFLEGHIKEFYN